MSQGAHSILVCNFNLVGISLPWSREDHAIEGKKKKLYDQKLISWVRFPEKSAVLTNKFFLKISNNILFALHQHPAAILFCV